MPIEQSTFMGGQFGRTVKGKWTVKLAANVRSKDPKLGSRESKWTVHANWRYKKRTLWTVSIDWIGTVLSMKVDGHVIYSRAVHFYENVGPDQDQQKFGNLDRIRPGLEKNWSGHAWTSLWIPGHRNENRVEVEVKYVEAFYNDFVLIWPD